MAQAVRAVISMLTPIQELTDANPTRFVRLLGEDLVLFRDKGGNVGLIQGHCVQSARTRSERQADSVAVELARDRDALDVLVLL
jgi:hypothetical protein